MSAKKSMAIWVFLSVAVAVLSLGAALILPDLVAKATAKGQAEVAALVPVTAIATDGALNIAVEAVSVAEPALSASLRNRTAGYVRSILTEGTKVAPGMVIVAFDDAELHKTLAQTELSRRQAQVSLERTRAVEARSKSDMTTKKNLLVAKATTQDTIDAAGDALATALFARNTAEFSLEQATLAAEQAKRDLGEATIRASFAGVVSRPSLVAGDFAPANSQLAFIIDLSRILFRAEVDEYDIGKLRVGLPVTVTVPALGDAVFRAQVDAISPAAEIVNNISIFRVSVFVDNKDGQLKPGMSADVTVLVSNEKGITVPFKAVTTVRERSYVDVLGQSGEIETRRVSLGSSDGRTVIVVEGLAAGEKVVTGPASTPTAAAPPASPPGGSSIIPITVPGQGMK
ncbi:MAG: efflux RND transporter periplasmic adaptor subunit [Rectinemataceae bacterium]